MRQTELKIFYGGGCVAEKLQSLSLLSLTLSQFSEAEKCKKIFELNGGRLMQGYMKHVASNFPF